jgi:hypothetical protein
VANFIQGTQLRTLNRGNLVTKGPAVVPNAAPGNLFTVSGGAVLITSLIGKVTTVFTASATTLNMGAAPTTGTANASAIHAITVLTSAAVGAWVTPVLASGIATVGIVANAISWTENDGGQFVVDAGSITYQASAANTGQIKWFLTYLPLDDGASVA